MFLFKKIIAPFFFPIPLCLEILLLGLVLLWFTRKQKAGKIVVSIGFVLLAILAYDAVPNRLLRPLEYKYSPILNVNDDLKVQWVVVLGGGHTADPQLPSTSQLSEASLFRLIEGIRLHRMLSGSKLILSGGSAFHLVPNAKVLADVALAIGVEKENLILESISKDTRDEALFLQKILGDEKFILVTSASHMPRSMALFEKLGMIPIPAPTDYLIKKRKVISPGIFFPGAAGLRKAGRAFYEYLGLAWAEIRGQI